MRYLSSLTFFLALCAELLFSQQTQEYQLFKPTLKFGGRIQYDLEFLSQAKGEYDEDTDTYSDYYFSGQEFRRVFLEVGGNLYKNVKYKMQFDFKGSDVRYRDLYIQFTKLPIVGGDLNIGSLAQATGLDMYTSSKYIPFLERAMLTATQNFRWDTGIGYQNFYLLKGKMTLQTSYTFNADQTNGFKLTALDEGGHFTTRLTGIVAENKAKHQLVHLGINYENHKYSKDPADYPLKFRPENHMGQKVNVGVPYEIEEGGEVIESGYIFNDLKNQSDVGLELAGIAGPLSVQGEFEKARYNTQTENYNINSYYALASYFITGEHRSFKKAAFGKIKPFNNFCLKDSNWGAIALLARYSVMDYSDVINRGYEDSVKNLTFGLNWYLNPNTKLMYNYIITDYNKKSDNNKLLAHLVRLQIFF